MHGGGGDPRGFRGRGFRGQNFRGRGLSPGGTGGDPGVPVPVFGFSKKNFLIQKIFTPKIFEEKISKIFLKNAKKNILNNFQIFSQRILKFYQNKFKYLTLKLKFLTKFNNKRSSKK